MNNIAQNLDDQLRAEGIPIHGVSIGRRDDRATWRVDFMSEATPEQQTAALQLVESFDATAPDAADEDRTGVGAENVALLLTRITARQAQITSDLALLPTATAAQQRAIMDRMLTTQRLELEAIERIAKALRRLV